MQALPPAAMMPTPLSCAEPLCDDAMHVLHLLPDIAYVLRRRCARLMPLPLMRR